MAIRYVYDFDEATGGGRELLGGKGVGLAEMTQLGIPVPAGFTITTDACRAYLETRQQYATGPPPPPPPPPPPKKKKKKKKKKKNACSYCFIDFRERMDKTQDVNMSNIETFFNPKWSDDVFPPIFLPDSKMVELKYMRASDFKSHGDALLVASPRAMNPPAPPSAPAGRKDVRRAPSSASGGNWR